MNETLPNEAKQRLSCRRKKKRTPIQAAIKIIEQDCRVSAYICPVCSHWHLTEKRPSNRNKKLLALLLELNSEVSNNSFNWAELESRVIASMANALTPEKKIDTGRSPSPPPQMISLYPTTDVARRIISAEHERQIRKDIPE